jgi:hypothetical protein
MGHPIAAVAGVLGLIGLAMAGSAQAQDHLRPSPWESQSKVNIAYEEPADPLYHGVYQRLKQGQVLERLQRFLAPVRFSRPLNVKMAQCGNNTLYRPYQPGGGVTICYEFVKQVEDLAPPEGSNGIVGVVIVPREATIIGPVVEEVLHDVALAIFDNLQVPVWGRPVDAADNVAALIMLQFGTDVAQRTILGTAYFLFVAGANAQYNVDYVADVRPPVRQRYYNILCVAYGADPVKFSVLQAFNRNELQMDLPPGRADYCAFRYASGNHKGEFEGEYEKLAAAFKTLILDPYVDPELLKQVLATEWLQNP